MAEGVPLWVIGLLLAVLSAFVSNFGLNLQKLSHIRIKKAEEEAEEEGNESVVKKSYTKEPIWILGIVLVFIGSLLDFGGLAIAPQSLIAPLGSLTLVSNAILAPKMLGEQISRSEILITALIIAGCAMAVAFASHKDKIYESEELFRMFTKTPFIIYWVFICVYMAMLRYVIYWVDKKRKESGYGDDINMTGNLEDIVETERDDESVSDAHSLADGDYNINKLVLYERFAMASLAGCMGAQTVLFAKCSSQLLIKTFSGEDIMFVHFESYIVLFLLVATIYLQLKWLNKGLQLYHALVIVPVFQSFWILVSVIAGIIFFGEYKQIFDDLLSSIFFPIGVSVTIFGVFLLSRQKVEEIDGISEPLLDGENGVYGEGATTNINQYKYNGGRRSVSSHLDVPYVGLRRSRGMSACSVGSMTEEILNPVLLHFGVAVANDDAEDIVSRASLSQAVSGDGDTHMISETRGDGGGE